MKPTEESHKLMSFFIEHKCLLPIKNTKKTNEIFKKFYHEIRNGVSYIENIKGKMGPSFYKLKVDHIQNVSQIPKPVTFPPNAFPSIIRKHIDEFALSVLTYSFHLFGRKISIVFTTEETHASSEKYNNYVDWMLVWLYIVNEYASRSCASQLKIFVYHTSLTKQLPQSNIEVLGEKHINTAFTRTCPTNAEIVVFRKEEWFKAFMHETFHNLGLDFSGIDNTACSKKILSIFPVNSEVNLYESYTEFWARIMNALFCSYIYTPNNNINEFLKYTEFFIHFELIYAFFQMVKILNFMDIEYKQLYEKSVIAETVRNTLYKEDTSVLSYYIITLILLNNYQSFLSWCDTNNTSILQFKKTTANIDAFCNFIGKKYKTKSMLDGIACSKELFVKVKKMFTKTKKQNDLSYILQNLRMTICELG